MVTKEQEDQIIQLWEQYSHDPETIAKNIDGITVDDVVATLKAHNISAEQSGGHAKRTNRRPPSWKLNVENFLRREMVRPFITALMACDGGYLPKDQFRQIADNLTLTYKDIADNVGLDYEVTKDYMKIVGFFVQQREQFVNIINELSAGGTFKKWQDMGLNEWEMFTSLVMELMWRGFFPVATDPNDMVESVEDGRKLYARRLRVLDLDDFLRLVIRDSAKRISVQVEKKSNMIRALDRYIPILDQIVKVELNDGTMFSLPIICPMDGQEFRAASDFEQHLKTTHITT